MIRKYIEEMKPTISYEILLFIPNEDLQEKVNSTEIELNVGSEKASSAYSLQTNLILHYSNILRKIDTFAEIEYQNKKDGNIHLLFNSSKRIKNKTDSTELPPLESVNSLTAAELNNSIFVLQGMPPFGDVISEYHYTYSENFISFSGKNKTFIKYKGFAAVRPGDMFLVSQIFRTDSGILIYGTGTVKISGLGVFFKKVIRNSFTSRMIGFFNWIQSQ